jgi:hypothetical protein
MRLLFETSAPVRASAADVRAVIDSDWMLDALLPGDARSFVDVDRGPGTLGVQGHWWYRGEISAAETPTGTRLVQRVFNVARKGAWAVPLANRFFVGFREQLQGGTDELARQVEKRLGGSLPPK